MELPPTVQLNLWKFDVTVWNSFHEIKKVLALTWNATARFGGTVYNVDP